LTALAIRIEPRSRPRHRACVDRCCLFVGRSTLLRAARALGGCQCMKIGRDH
jgi:hypothetical protein